MTKLYRSALIAGAGVFLFILLLGVVGDYDYCDQVILSMSQEQYDSVRKMLFERDGCEPSERKIAHWWADHHE